jgi:hypothetical protein
VLCGIGILAVVAPVEASSDAPVGHLPPNTLQAFATGDALVHDRSGLPLLPPGSNFYDTSEFMLGKVAIAFILPESDGSIDASVEDWTQAELDTVTAEVLAGLEWWVDRAKWRDLSFHPVFRYSVPTGYEPITRTSYDEMLWVTDALANLGYGDSAYPLNIYEYANDLRDSLQTDWAVVAFIVDSSNDADGLFANGVAAYSYIGGPNLIMSYKNGNAGIGLMDWVTTHELTHSFYAWDEYHEMSPPCTASTGYFDVENQNSISPYGPGGCAINVTRCIMRLSAAPNNVPCYYTKGQIGWWDSDGDSIPDLLDTFPETVLFPYTPDPCSTVTPTYTGTARVVPVSNRNRQGEGNDITLERITAVEFRVDGSAWNEAAPVDGAWDDAEEDYVFATEHLVPGLHIIETRAVQTCGNYDTTSAVDSLTVSELAGVEGRPAEESSTYGRSDGQSDSRRIALRVQPSPFGAEVTITYRIPGAPGEADRVSLCAYDINGRMVRRLVSRFEGSGNRSFVWDGHDSVGAPAPSGVYFLELVVGGEVLVRKILLIR